jgi:hypothetical protein
MPPFLERVLDRISIPDQSERLPTLRSMARRGFGQIVGVTPSRKALNDSAVIPWRPSRARRCRETEPDSPQIRYDPACNVAASPERRRLRYRRGLRRNRCPSARVLYQTAHPLQARAAGRHETRSPLHHEFRLAGCTGSGTPSLTSLHEWRRDGNITVLAATINTAIPPRGSSRLINHSVGCIGR